MISFNLGSMGFLANHDFATFKHDLLDVIYGSTRLDSCTLMSLDTVSSMDEPGNSLGERAPQPGAVSRVCKAGREGGRALHVVQSSLEASYTPRVHSEDARMLLQSGSGAPCAQPGCVPVD